MRISVFGATGATGSRVVAETMVAALRDSGVRLLLVGGSASLRVASGELRVETADFPAGLRPIALARTDQPAVAEASTGVDRTYLSPPMWLAPGVRTGSYRVGGDEPLFDERGESAISMQDFRWPCWMRPSSAATAAASPSPTERPRR